MKEEFKERLIDISKGTISFIIFIPISLFIINLFTMLIGHKNIFTIWNELNAQADLFVTSGTAGASATLLNMRFFIIGLFLLLTWWINISIYWKDKEGKI